MPFKVIVTRDFAQMSEVAGKIVLGELKSFRPTAEKQNYVLGLATGNSPTGLYQYLADYQKQFKAEQVVTFNLDEYVGLPGENAQQRALHPESYSFFMIQQLFSKLDTKFKQTHVPFGTLIEQQQLIAEMKKHGEQAYTLEGSDSGRAVVLKKRGPSDYLNWIRTAILDRYTKLIQSYGGIDLHVVGVGGRGHVAFHESGIPLKHEMLLVKLDENTIDNAVKDGHFETKQNSPQYAISMGAGLVYKARTVLLVANGGRKTGPVAESLLGPVTADVPISCGQTYAQGGGNMVYVLDEIAAGDLLSQRSALRAKGIQLEDRRQR